MTRALIILAAYLVLGLPAAVFGLPWTLLSRDIGFLYRWAMWVVRTGLRLGGIRIAVSGREHIPPQTACIFMSNHVSNLDPPVLAPLLPVRTAFFLKQSLLKIPALGYGMRLAGFIPVRRDGRVESAQESVAFAKGVLASGTSVMTFPEGTRSRNGELLPFKKGPFYLALESGAAVVPVSIWGTAEMMPKGSLRIRPGTAHVIFHSAIEPRRFATREELMAAVRAAIQSGLPKAGD
ncbi:MAG TPA: lysophospholipid acyltransferase family protein [Acidobacteriaceae bacterium]|jgi:1-acyl-sn-glycerol-3-phosphate acyltransferase|nr:lysophospholipid acyltransferase family protein [Acidobacteriaceae bacterium]